MMDDKIPTYQLDYGSASGLANNFEMPNTLNFGDGSDIANIIHNAFGLIDKSAKSDVGYIPPVFGDDMGVPDDESDSEKSETSEAMKALWGQLDDIRAKNRAEMDRVGLGPEALGAILPALFGGTRGAALGAGIGRGMEKLAEVKRSQRAANLAVEREDTLLKLQETSKREAEDREAKRVDRAKKERDISFWWTKYDSARTDADIPDLQKAAMMLRSLGATGAPDDKEIMAKVGAIKAGKATSLNATIEMVRARLKGQTPTQVAASLDQLEAYMAERAEADPHYKPMDPNEKAQLLKDATNTFSNAVSKEVRGWLSQTNNHLLREIAITQGLTPEQVAESITMLRNQAQALLDNTPGWEESGWTVDSLVGSLLDPNKFVGPSRQIVQMQLNRSAADERARLARDVSWLQYDLAVRRDDENWKKFMYTVFQKDYDTTNEEGWVNDATKSSNEADAAVAKYGKLDANGLPESVAQAKKNMDDAYARAVQNLDEATAPYDKTYKAAKAAYEKAYDEFQQAKSKSEFWKGRLQNAKDALQAKKDRQREFAKQTEQNAPPPAQRGKGAPPTMPRTTAGTIEGVSGKSPVVAAGPNGKKEQDISGINLDRATRQAQAELAAAVDAWNKVVRNNKLPQAEKKARLDKIKGLYEKNSKKKWPFR